MQALKMRQRIILPITIVFSSLTFSLPIEAHCRNGWCVQGCYEESIRLGDKRSKGAVVDECHCLCDKKITEKQSCWMKRYN